MVSITDRQNLLSSESVVDRQIAEVLSCFREELDDHRLAINENTGELASNMDALNELNDKVDKLAERLDELTLLVKGTLSKRGFEIKPLNAREKDVFHALYEVTESSPYATYEQLSRMCSLTKDAIAAHVSAMSRKGVPVVKRLNGSVVMLRLDEAFREEQAKKNLVGLSSLLHFL